MAITISRILESLKDFPLDASVPNRSASITSVQYAPESLENICDDVLYIVPSEDVAQEVSDVSISAINILCVHDTDRLPVDWSSPNSNVIVLRDANDLPSAVNRVLSLFSELFQIWDYHKIFMKILSGADSVRRLLETGCQILQQPILLYNSSFVVIEHADCPDLDDLRWISISREGKALPSTIQRIMEVRLLERIRESDWPIISDHTRQGSRSVWSKIVSNNQIMGYLVVLEFKKMVGDRECEIISMLCDALAIAMMNHAEKQSKNNVRFEKLITDRLDGSNKVEHSVFTSDVTRFTEMDWNNILLCIVRIDDVEKPNTPIFYIRDQIQQSIPFCKCLVYKDDILLLANGGNVTEADFTTLLTHKISDILSENNLRCGMSRLFHDLFEVRDYYDQAMLALCLGTRMDRKKNIFYFDQYVVYYPMLTFDDKFDTLQLCHYSVRQLIEIDQQNNTDYLETMREYLHCKGNALAASKALHIHRNTLYYRLEKIKEMTGVVLNDASADLLFLLEYSFYILKYSGSR